MALVRVRVWVSMVEQLAAFMVDLMSELFSIVGCSEPADSAAETSAASSSAAVGESEESAATEAVAGGNDDDDDVYVDVDVLAESDSEL